MTGVVVEPGAVRVGRVNSGPGVDASDAQGGNPKGDTRTYPEGSFRPPARPRPVPSRPDHESGRLMRVYVPLTLPGLAEAHRTGELGTGPLAAYAVTPALREWYRSQDTEELEYAALNRAALASLRLLAADAAASRRRVVVAADVPDAAVSSGSDRDLDRAAPGEVRLSGPLPLAKAASVHVDSADAEADVTAAAEALAAADGGDDEALFVVDGAEEHELLWYATQELPNLV
ncbi:hypothetical protein GCM10010424_57770 [Streptomyces lienomycini]